MQLNTAEQLRMLRKTKGFTQEQLAEALGVSHAAVSKWERGAAVPDLNYLAEMADLFDVSMDVLVGYRMRSSALADRVERIRSLQREKRFEEGAAEAEKALVCYPHDFQVVYRSGKLYEMMGIEKRDPDKRRRALCRAAELLERSLGLIAQNEDPGISEGQIRSELAACCLALGQAARGIGLLKAFNVGGMNDARIGMEMAIRPEYPPEETGQYLMQALIHGVQNLLLTMTGYANYYERQNDHGAALETLEWLTGFLESLKTDDQTVGYMDKILAPLYAEGARLHEVLGHSEKVRPFLERAFQRAVRFDAAPVYHMAGMKFAIGDTEYAAAYDDLGASTMEAVEHQMREQACSAALQQAWNTLKESV